MVANDLLERTFDALGNPHRREIIDRLMGGPLDTPVLGACFDMSKQALNKHLVVLERAGLIDRRLNGRVHRVHLRPDPLDTVVDWVSAVRRGWESSFDRLGDLLERKDP